MSERKEALMRIVVAIVTGIILSLWKTLVQLLVIVNWFIVIFTGERNKGLAEFCEIWSTQVYVFLKYITFVSNDRPFPFTSLTKNMGKFK